VIGSPPARVRRPGCCRRSPRTAGRSGLLWVPARSPVVGRHGDRAGIGDPQGVTLWTIRPEHERTMGAPW